MKIKSKTHKIWHLKVGICFPKECTHLQDQTFSRCSRWEFQIRKFVKMKVSLELLRLVERNFLLLSISSHFHLQEVTSDFSIPYCYYNGPDNGFSIADVMYASSGVTANVTFTQKDLEESQKSTSPTSILRLEAICHTNHML